MRLSVEQGIQLGGFGTGIGAEEPCKICENLKLGRNQALTAVAKATPSLRWVLAIKGGGSHDVTWPGPLTGGATTPLQAPLTHPPLFTGKLSGLPPPAFQERRALWKPGPARPPPGRGGERGWG